MQERDGTFTQLTETQLGNLRFWQQPKVINVGQVFKIRWCYFQITEIDSEGIKAKGISRKEYYALKRGRPDWGKPMALLRPIERRLKGLNDEI